MPTSFLFELDDLKELSLDLPQLLQLALDQEDQLQNLEVCFSNLRLAKEVMHEFSCKSECRCRVIK